MNIFTGFFEWCHRGEFLGLKVSQCSYILLAWKSTHKTQASFYLIQSQSPKCKELEVLSQTSSQFKFKVRNLDFKMGLEWNLNLKSWLIVRVHLWQWSRDRGRERASASGECAHEIWWSRNSSQWSHQSRNSSINNKSSSNTKISISTLNALTLCRNNRFREIKYFTYEHVHLFHVNRTI